MTQTILNLINAAKAYANYETIDNLNALNKAIEEAEELEVPVAGVMDEGLQDEDLLKGIDINNLLERAKWYVADQNGFDSWGALLQYYKEQADEIDPEEESTLENIIDDVSCKYGYDLSRIISKLSVTGNKPLKTSKEVLIEVMKKHYPEFSVIRIERDLDTSVSTQAILDAMEEYANQSHPTPIDTLDKEELLKQAKDNVAKKIVRHTKYNSRGDYYENWYELRQAISDNFIYNGNLDNVINSISEEYLRLCTGGGEKE